MIDLSQRTEPYDLDLPYGLTVTVKPLTTAGMTAAQAAARRAVEAIERQISERKEAGLPTEGLPDLDQEADRDGFYQSQLIRELAVRHITDWAGVELEGGQAPPIQENIAAVINLYPVGERFFQEFTLRQVLLTAAKNGSGLSAAGIFQSRGGPEYCRGCREARLPCSRGGRGSEGRPCPYREHPLISRQEHEAWDVLSAGQGQLRLAPSGQVISIDLNVAMQIATALGADIAVLSELLPAAEAGMVEALNADS